jgi:hypothetical protein
MKKIFQVVYSNHPNIRPDNILVEFKGGVYYPFVYDCCGLKNPDDHAEGTELRLYSGIKINRGVAVDTDNPQYGISVKRIKKDDMETLQKSSYTKDILAVRLFYSRIVRRKEFDSDRWSYVWVSRKYTHC